MAKRKLNFDIGRMNEFCEVYEEQVVYDGFGGVVGVSLVLIATPRCVKSIKTKTSQIQQQSGAWDFYQATEFLIRKSPNFAIKKDMEIRNNGNKYVVRGVYPLENRPQEYIVIITETKQ